MQQLLVTTRSEGGTQLLQVAFSVSANGFMFRLGLLLFKRTLLLLLHIPLSPCLVLIILVNDRKPPRMLICYISSEDVHCPFIVEN